MNFNLMEKPSPHDDIPSTYEMLKKMSKLWQGIDDDKFKKPEVEYKIL